MSYRHALSASRRCLPPARPIKGPAAFRSLTTASTPPPSFLRRTFALTGRFLLFSSLGLLMAAAPAYQAAATMLAPPSDADTLTLFAPADPDARAKQAFIDAHPLTLALRADPSFVESRPHLKIPPAWRKHNLTGGTLLGPGRVAVPPLTFADAAGTALVQITHVGTDLCGHQGVIHGGFLATMLDEGLARCCFPALPHHIGMTAKLDISYKAPALADQYLVLRATTVKVEGRKAWVEGHIETLPEEGKEAVVLATASALYISPRQASTMAKVYPVA